MDEGGSGFSVFLDVAHTLEGWGEFYVIVGAAAGALIGLMFVVIALRSEGASANSVDRFEAYATPTLVAFATVLAISALATVPALSAVSMSICLVVSGIAGLVYCLYNTRQVQGQQGYAYMSDWAWRHVLPGLDYAALLVAGAVVWWDDALALYIVGASAAVMLFIGIHNAWDTAVWIAAEHPEDSEDGA